MMFEDSRHVHDFHNVASTMLYDVPNDFHVHLIHSMEAKDAQQRMNFRQAQTEERRHHPWTKSV